MSRLMNQAKNRWDRFAYIIKQSVPNHKHDHFNMIAQMSRRELKEFIIDNKYVYEIKTNSKLSASNMQMLSMMTYAKNLLRLRS
jgi:hypothetical protein